MASDLVERLLGMAKDFAGWREPRETWISALTEATGLIKALRRELEATIAALSEQSRLNEEARQSLAIIADVATGPTAHEGNLLRQIGDAARKAMRDPA